MAEKEHIPASSPANAAWRVSAILLVRLYQPQQCIN